jgi:hypothetical protein
MKILKQLALTAVLAMTAASAHATYQITFNTLNDLAAPTNPVFDSDLTTRLSGANGWVGQIYVSIGGGAFAAIKDASDATSGAKAFATGGAAGWITTGGDLTVNNAAVTANPTAAAYRLHVWNTANGSTFEQAVSNNGKVGISGSALGTVNFNSPGTSVNLLGYSTGAPPIGYPAANGFASFSVAVPEPATIALGLFGAAGLLIRRRK